MRILHSDSKKTLPLIENVTFIVGRETLHKVFGTVDMCVSRRHVEIVALDQKRWRAKCLSSSNKLRAFPDIGKKVKLVSKNESVVLSTKNGYFYLYGSKHRFSLSFEDEKENESRIPTPTQKKKKKIREICINIRKDELKSECIVPIDTSVDSFVKIVAKEFKIKNVEFIRGIVSRGRNIPMKSTLSIQDVEIKDGDFVDIIVSSDNDGKCAICLNDIKMSEKRGALPCCHTFHMNCIQTWSKVDNSCPLCKKRFGHIESFIPGDDAHETIEIRKDTSTSTTTNATTTTTTTTTTTNPMEDTYAGCVHCRSSAREDVLLICDLCGDYWHTYCLPTPLSAVPEGDFYCPKCEEMPEPVNSQISDEDYEPSANLEEEEKKDELEQYTYSSWSRRKNRKRRKRRVVDSDDESESDESIDEEDDEEELIDVISPPRRSRKKKKIKKKKPLPISSWISKRR